MTEAPRFEDLQYRVEGAVAFITLDRPDARNAYSEVMVESLLAALDAAALDEAVRAVVLTGAGDAFSAGGDLKRMRDRAGMFDGDAATLRDRYIALIQRIPRRMALFDKPIVAAVHGPAIGAGLDLACMCDVRVASPAARFGSTFVQVGLVPGDGGAYVLARTVGFPRALEMVMSARLVDAEEAATMGLVHAVVPADQLAAEALRRATHFTRLPPVALRLAKRAAYRSYDVDLEVALELA
ncbi:MAG: enoyl-CoA hydratase-related protein, partial [bacterium]